MANPENTVDTLNTGESEETTTVRKKLGRPSLNPTETVREMARQMFTGLQDTDIGKAIALANRSLELMAELTDRAMTMAEALAGKVGSPVESAEVKKPAVTPNTRIPATSAGKSGQVAEAKTPVATETNPVDDMVTAVGDAVSASVPAVKATRKRVWL